MTWCSVDNATPRFDLASSAIRCRFVDRFVRLKVLSHVSRQRSSPRDTPHPSVGSWRVQFPDVKGTMRVLRLPAHASPVTYICFASGAHATFLRSRRLRSQKCGGCSLGQDHCSAGDPISGALSRGHERDLTGSQAVHPMPLPRSMTPAEPTIPRLWRSRQCCPCSAESKGFSVSYISRLPRSFSTCCLRFTSGVATAHASLASGWLAGLYREGVEPSGSR